MDIKSMYTNIPQEEGIKSLLTKSNVVGLPPHIIRKMLNYILKCNTFSFNGKLYQQINGIAMGTPIAPTLANIFMSDVEEFLETQVFKPLVYKRYIDDIFMIWTHGQQKLDTFYANYNAFHPNVKFDITSSATEIDYLDLTIFVPNNFNTTRTLATRTHIKPTNTFQYIHFTSHHPLAVKKSVLFSPKPVASED